MKQTMGAVSLMRGSALLAVSWSMGSSNGAVSTSAVSVALVQETSMAVTWRGGHGRQSRGLGHPQRGKRWGEKDVHKKKNRPRNHLGHLGKAGARLALDMLASSAVSAHQHAEPAARRARAQGVGPSHAAAAARHTAPLPTAMAKVAGTTVAVVAVVAVVVRAARAAARRAN